MQEIVFRYWGKAGPGKDPDNGGLPTRHLLPYHCLDVAAVGMEWLRCHPAVARNLGNQFGLAEEAVIRLVGFLAALHDIGKFADAFQGGEPDIQKVLQGRISKLRYRYRHDTLGLALFLDDFAKARTGWLGMLDFDPEAWQALALASACHHGKPGKILGGSESRALFREHFRETDREAAKCFAVEVAGLFRVCELCVTPHEIEATAAKHVSWLIAGLISLADWVASGGMAYCSAQQPLADYWETAKQRAATLLRERGLIPPVVAQERNLGNLFPGLACPSALQLQAQNAPLAEGPQLFILEDVTGAGKTEAALLLARGLADGLYFALPTQATANAIYRRLSEVLADFFRNGETISLILAHGSRDLSPVFRRAMLGATEPEFTPEDGEAPATVACCRSGGWGESA